MDAKNNERDKSLNIKQGEIIFDNVNFCYDNKIPLFQNLSITIRPGQRIGLVGYSGSGKTTFIRLILRLFNVNSGCILIDGQDISEVNQASLNASIGFIPQEPSLFHRSLMENIRYGKIDASDTATIEAAKCANIHDFIRDLPQGYQTLVGERGIKLSGGQRQRIAIARAMLKNAPILILDEATSQLDSLTENKIKKSLENIMFGKTTIIIAHRLSTLLHLDRILVFKNGEIIDTGTHRELMENCTTYQSLWNAQIGGFLPLSKENIIL